MSGATHVQTITHGFIGNVPTYYYRECSCGFQGPPRYSVNEVIAMGDRCPHSPTPESETTPTERSE